MLCEKYGISAREFVDMWKNTMDKHIRYTKTSGLFPTLQGLIVIDLRRNLVYINTESGYWKDISWMAAKFDCKVYDYNLFGFEEMKEALKKGGFKFTEREEKEWYIYYCELKGRYHITVQNA